MFCTLKQPFILLPLNKVRGMECRIMLFNDPWLYRSCWASTGNPRTITLTTLYNCCRWDGVHGVLYTRGGKMAPEAKPRVPFFPRGCTKFMDPKSQRATIVLL